MNININGNINSLNTTDDAPLIECTNTNTSKKRHEKNKLNHKLKKRKHFQAEKNLSITFDDLNHEEKSNDCVHDDECVFDEDHTQEHRSSTTNTPSFVGRRVACNTSESTGQQNVSSMFQQLLGVTLKSEARYLRPLLVAQERMETTIKCLLVNQQKIQKALRRHKVVS